jgi:hypothetical protein
MRKSFRLNKETLRNLAVRELRFPHAVVGMSVGTCSCGCTGSCDTVDSCQIECYLTRPCCNPPVTA